MNSEIILVRNINVDKQYTNVLNYSEANMLSLCRANAVATATNHSFLRPTGTLFVGFTYAQCLQANYIAFQNPDYSNKWFFAWIDDVIYKSDKNCEIKFTIDAWSTWFSYWTSKPCYVLRHHVNDDVVGRYTLPEGLETGEYIIDNYIRYDDFDDMSYIIQCTEWSSGSDDKPLATNFGGVYSAGGAYICPDIRTVVNILQAFATLGKSDAVFGVYMCPTSLINNTSGSLQYSGQSTPLYGTQTINKPSRLNGYTPKNKKLLTFPYCFINLSNNNGTTNSYLYELFNEIDENPNQCIFNIKGVPTVGASIKCTPFNYKNNAEEDNEDEGILGGKFPTLSWSEDAYINWLTQNSVNIGIGVASSLITIVGGLGMMASGALAGAGTVVSGSMSIANQIGQVYQHSLTPNTAKGNTNGGDINSSSNANTFYFEQMSIKQEYAKIIDDYFTRYGYKINRIISPNITGRPYYNYIEIGSSEVIGTGSVPSKFMDIINNACRKGVTIWHNHANIGDYTLNNSI